MGAEVKKGSLKYLIHIAIMLFFFFGFRYITPPATITVVGMQILGVFLGLIWGWMFIDMLWPSLLGMFALGLTDYCKNVFAAMMLGVGNSNVLLILFFFIFTYYVQYSGLGKTIAFKMLTFKAVEHKPWMLVFMILAAAYVLGILIHKYAVIFMIWAIVYDISTLAGYKKQDALPAFLLVGVIQAGAISGCVMPFQSWAALCFNALSDATGLTIPVVPFISYNLVVTFLAVFAYFLAGKYVLKIDVSKLQGLTKEDILQNNEIIYQKEQKIATVVVITFLAMIIIPSFLPEDWAVTILFNKMGTQGVLALILCVIAAIKLDGKPLVNIAKLINGGINWSLMFLLVATYAIGGAVNSDEAGVITLVSDVLTPIFSGMSGIVFLLASFVMLLAVTQFAHNIVLAVVFIPLLSTMALNAGMGETIAMLVALGLHVLLLQALLTPAASNRGAMIYGNDWVGRHYAFVYGAAAIITCCIIVLVIGIPLGLLMF